MVAQRILEIPTFVSHSAEDLGATKKNNVGGQPTKFTSITGWSSWRLHTKRQCMSIPEQVWGRCGFLQWWCIRTFWQHAHSRGMGWTQDKLPFHINLTASQANWSSLQVHLDHLKLPIRGLKPGVHGNSDWTELLSRPQTCCSDIILISLTRTECTVPRKCNGPLLRPATMLVSNSWRIWRLSLARLAVGVGRNSTDRKGAQQAGLPTNVFNSFLLKWETQNNANR